MIVPEISPTDTHKITTEIVVISNQQSEEIRSWFLEDATYDVVIKSQMEKRPHPPMPKGWTMSTRQFWGERTKGK